MTKTPHKTLRTAQELLADELVAETDLAALESVAAKYSIAISPHLQRYIQRDGISKQFVPSKDELHSTPQELIDPIGDKPHSPVRGIIHRYPDRCLLQPVSVCPVYCRFCFRRETMGKGNPALTPQELDACYTYIQQNPAIWEVILSGGDPLILKAAQLSKIIHTLDQIPHVEIIRIHTRVPMVDPDRINPEVVAALSQRRPVYVVLHINHPDEFTPESIAAVDALVNNGIVLLGQSVLLKGVNDNLDTLGLLMRKMIKYRIKPYYLHHLDLAKGTNHFRTSITKGQELIAGLRGNYSGLCQPQYVLDIPGGAGKSPIGPNYLTANNHNYTVRNYLGEEFKYSDAD
jgi:lysine 2,3-aminomutase